MATYMKLVVTVIFATATVYACNGSESDEAEVSAAGNEQCIETVELKFIDE